MISVMDHLDRLERNLQAALQTWCEGMSLRVCKLERILPHMLDSMAVLENRIKALEMEVSRNGK